VVNSPRVRVPSIVDARTRSSSSTPWFRNIFFFKAVPTIVGGVANFKAHLTLWLGATGVACSPSVGVGGTPVHHSLMTATPTAATICAARAAPIGATTMSSGHGKRGAARGAMRLEARVLLEAQQLSI
jgi:hypothetical protein